MKQLYIFILFLLFIFNASSQEKKNILFIGNSLTYFNKMPFLLQQMLSESNSDLNIEQSTFPGMSFINHFRLIITSRTENGINARKKLENEITETELKLKSKNWDIIILQEATNTFYYPEAVNESLYPFIYDFKAKFNNSKLILFKTWPSLTNYPIFNQCFPKYYFDRDKYYVNEEISNNEVFCSNQINNYIEDILFLEKQFNYLSEKLAIDQSNHCLLNGLFHIKYPEIKIYDDEYHPSKIGSFFNACIFYKQLTGKSLKKLKFNGEIDAQTAKTIKKFIDKHFNIKNL